MSRLLAIFLIAISLRADDTNSVPAPASGVDVFQLIWKRNIFDPQRSSDGRTPPPADPEKVVVTESFTLLGAMSYEKGRFAFFDGTSSEYRKTLQAGGEIGGFKVAEIDPSRVVLESAEKKIDFPVGAQMKRQDRGEWKFNEHSDFIAASAPPSGGDGSGGESRRDYGDRSRDSDRDRDRDRDRRREWERDRGERREYSSGGSSSASSTNRPSSGGSEGMSDVLKRLMEKREQELKK